MLPKHPEPVAPMIRMLIVLDCAAYAAISLRRLLVHMSHGHVSDALELVGSILMVIGVFGVVRNRAWRRPAPSAYLRGLAITVVLLLVLMAGTWELGITGRPLEAMSDRAACATGIALTVAAVINLRRPGSVGALRRNRARIDR